MLFERWIAPRPRPATPLSRTCASRRPNHTTPLETIGILCVAGASSEFGERKVLDV